MMTRVAFVIASHSDLLTRGIAELAEQMAPDVVSKAAGGTEGGGIGTSYGRVEAAVNSALEAVRTEAGSGVVVLTDPGFALMTVEAVFDFADDPEHIVFVDAPVVGVTTVASVKAQLGDSLGNVVATARNVYKLAAEEAEDFDLRPEPATWDDEPMTVGVLVADPVGLHARPAALVARVAGSFDAEVTLNDADATSVLELMAPGVTQGQRVELSASGPEAAQALDVLTKTIEKVE